MAVHPAVRPEGKAPFFVQIKRRTEGLCVLFAVLYFALACRLVYIQGFRHANYARLAEQWHGVKLPLVALRGPILTRDGYRLALTVHCGSVSANPQKIPVSDRTRVAQAVATCTGLPQDQLAGLIAQPRKFVSIARGIPATETARLRALVKTLKLPGIEINDNETRRVYPGGTLASNLIGATDAYGRGISGIEMKCNRQLSGQDGSVRAQIDGRREVISQSRTVEKQAIDGQPVHLSIDHTLQTVAEQQLDDMAARFKPAGATCTVMDVHTGEILAMATYPRFDPNNLKVATPAMLRNRAVEDPYEPGSTLKTLTVSAGLDAGVIDPSTTFHCSGQERLGKKTLKCVIEPPFHGGHGTVHPREIIAYSCNISAAHVGLRLGQDRLKEYLDRFGIGPKTGVELPGEWGSRADRKAQNWAMRKTADIAFGQGIILTPIQLLAAYASIGNDGEYVRPTLLATDRPLARRRILKLETARTMRTLLQACVQVGTGRPAKIRGYSVGGKTGSAQKAVKGLGYNTHKFIASFASLMPIDRPRFAVLVTVDEPKGVHWGAVVAAPVVREVARQAVIRLGIPPTDPNDTVDGADKRTWPKEHHA